MKKWILNKMTMAKRDSEYHWWQEHAEAKINLLKEKMAEIFRQLKTKKPEGSSSYRNTPWFLVIGAENSGKTSLLAKSNLGLTSVEDKSFTHTSPTTCCDWWLSKKAVFIDTSGGLIMPKKPSNEASLIWSVFLDLLHKYKRGAPAKGIILCVDLYDFQSKNHEDQQKEIDVFRHRIQTLRKYKCSLPVHLVFTKCDHIAGFIESYSTLSLEESHHMLGLSMPDTLPLRNVSGILEEEFNGLLKNMNMQLLGYLHREHCLTKRSLIKNFPLQIEAQKQGIMLLASQLHSQKTPLTTICFTSALQDGKTYDILKAHSHHFGLPVSSQQEDLYILQQQKSFFIQNFIKDIIKKSLTHQLKTKSNFIQNHTRFYATCASITLVFGLLMTYGYTHEKNTLADIQLTLAQSQKIDDAGDQAFIAQLAVLKEALNTAHERKQPITSVIFGHNRQLKNDLQQAYDLALQTKFSNMIRQFFETKLQHPENLNPKTLFETLKAYSMLKDPARMDQPFLSQWFTNDWQTIYPNQPKQQKILLSVLNDWVNLQSKNFNIDNNTLSQAQKKLNSASLSVLAYLHLQKMHSTGEQKTSVGKFFFINLPDPDSLYTTENFSTIYQKEIPKVAHQMTGSGNWVMHLNLPENLRKPVTEQLTKDLRKLYVQNYAIFWQTQLFAATLNDFQSINDADAFAKIFNTQYSPVMQLLDVVENRLAPLKDLPEAKEPLMVQRQIRTMLTTALANKETTASVNALQEYLAKLNQAEDKGRAVLTASQDRMKHHQTDPLSNMLHQAESAPAPLKNWLQALASHTWATMLKTSQQQLNLVWITEILPIYNETIKDRYPIFSDAKNDIALNTFTAFFGPGGTLNQFFEQELSAFANTEKLYWTWKKLDDQQLNIPQETLDMVNVASLIKRMFFPDNEGKLQLRFSITPNALTNVSTNYLLNLAGNTIDHSLDTHYPKNLIWPSEHSNDAWLEMRRNRDVDVIMEEKGDWALFKLLSYAKIQTTPNTRIFEVVFNANGVSVPYKLVADQAINPFIPNLFTTFRCPKGLM